MEQLGLLFAAMFAPVNLGYTVFLIVILVYWLLVIIGALGIDLFDFEAELDADGDIDVGGDVDADMDADADGGASGSGVHGLLHFFNLGEVPVMVFASIFVLSMWALAMTVNVMLNNRSLIVGLPIFVGNVFVSAFVAKFLTAPIKHVFRALDKNNDGPMDTELLGKTCVISTSEVNETFGQAVIETDGAPLILNVVTYKGEKIQKGQEAVIIEYIESKRVYTVKSRWDKED